MILVDFNQIMIAGVVMASNHSEEIDIKLVRHIFLSSIGAIRKKFGSEYGQTVLCCDHKRSWRKDAFPYYKANRAKGREESTLNWELVFGAGKNYGAING